MLSPQILSQGNDYALLEADRLVITTTAARTEIPLAVVQEVRLDDEKTVAVVLTDGVTHTVGGGNPTATGLFLTALTAALPEERDPAGSALVTVEDDPGAIPWPKVLAWGGLFVAAYTAYVWWTAVAHGGAMAVLAFVSGIGTILGVFSVIAVVIGLRDRWLLRRRGITVRATADYYPNGKRSQYYKFTDHNGNEHSQQGRNNSFEHIHVVYDPQAPGRHVQRVWIPIVVTQYFFGSLAALGLLALGLWGVLAPYI
ncbi:hypothetical protein [Streptomyces sp. NPDC056144]|uniref:hypothetical protein n=1 Tax=unclassified Streptomyces TaxID=2593676 RepID=UPI0035DD29EF